MPLFDGGELLMIHVIFIQTQKVTGFLKAEDVSL